MKKTSILVRIEVQVAPKGAEAENQAVLQIRSTKSQEWTLGTKEVGRKGIINTHPQDLILALEEQPVKADIIRDLLLRKGHTDIETNANMNKTGSIRSPQPTIGVIVETTARDTGSLQFSCQRSIAMNLIIPIKEYLAGMNRALIKTTIRPVLLQTTTTTKIVKTTPMQSPILLSFNIETQWVEI